MIVIDTGMINGDLETIMKEIQETLEIVGTLVEITVIQETLEITVILETLGTREMEGILKEESIVILIRRY
jgi:hypothetical protein